MRRQLTVFLMFFPVVAATAQTTSTSGNAFNAMKAEKVSKFVAIDTDTVIDYGFMLNPDCTPSGTVRYRVIKKSTHGEILLTDGDHFPGYDKENIRSSCNSQRVKAEEVHYKPAAGFTGVDSADIVTIYSDGSADRYVYEITVG